MENDIFSKFERQFEVLLQNYERMKKDNVMLRQKQSELLSECNSLREKNNSSAKYIEKTLDRLKNLVGNENECEGT